MQYFSVFFHTDAAEKRRRYGNYEQSTDAAYDTLRFCSGAGCGKNAPQGKSVL